VNRNDEKFEVRKLTAELALANKELVLHKEDKTKRAAELVLANKKLTLQHDKIKKQRHWQRMTI
jgi:hypothetical protein